MTGYFAVDLRSPISKRSLIARFDKLGNERRAASFSHQRAPRRCVLHFPRKDRGREGLGGPACDPAINRRAEVRVSEGPLGLLRGSPVPRG